MHVRSCMFFIRHACTQECIAATRQYVFAAGYRGNVPGLNGHYISARSAALPKYMHQSRLHSNYCVVTCAFNLSLFARERLQAEQYRELP